MNRLRIRLSDEVGYLTGPTGKTCRQEGLVLVLSEIELFSSTPRRPPIRTLGIEHPDTEAPTLALQLPEIVLSGFHAMCDAPKAVLAAVIGLIRAPERGTHVGPETVGPTITDAETSVPSSNTAVGCSRSQSTWTHRIPVLTRELSIPSARQFNSSPRWMSRAAGISSS